MRLAVVTSHPIQYNAPLFRVLAAREGISLKVFYTWSQTGTGEQFDPLFGKVIAWDIPLLDGYSYTFVDNVARDPGSHHFRGIKNPGLIAEIEGFKPDAILVFGWSFDSHLKCLRYFHGKIPVLFRGDSTLIGEHGGVRKLLRRMALRWVYHFVDIALYVGAHNKAYYLKHGLKENQLVFAPHAIDLSRFSASHSVMEERALTRRRELGIAPTDFVVLYAGKLEPRKNPFLIVDIARACQRPGLVFLVVGNGPLEAAMKKAAEGIPGLVFMDFQNQGAMPEVYRMGDVFLLPSVSETWGLAINEAMACHRPVIASTRVGAVPDLVHHDVTGWTFEPGGKSVEQLTRIVNGLVDDRSVALRAGVNAFTLAATYSYERIAEAVKTVLDGLKQSAKFKGVRH